jgi:hypothetical protein
MQSFKFGVDIIPEWFYGKDSKAAIRYALFNSVAVVPTADGEVIAHEGDTIIREDTGEMAVVKSV